MFTSCQQEEIIEPIDVDISETTDPDGQIQLIKQLENPYSLENMEKALSEVKSKDSNFPAITIEATHYYLKFLPKNEEQFNLLKADSTLELYDYPLDYEMKEGGTFYRDPKLAEGDLGWTYTVVPVSFQFPPISYEILAELFLPQETNASAHGARNQLDDHKWEQLENAALKLTDNWEEDSQEEQARRAKKVESIRLY